jgi:hypothetical protein
MWECVEEKKSSCGVRETAKYDKYERETGHENQHKGHNDCGIWSHDFPYARMDYWTEKLVE